MNRTVTDRPGRIIFLSGVVLVLASTGLGFYLSRPHRDDNAPLDWHLPDYDARLEAVRAEIGFLSNVNALMWLTFGLGVVLTLVGLRMLTHRLALLETEGPIKPFRDILSD